MENFHELTTDFYFEPISLDFYENLHKAIISFIGKYWEIKYDRPNTVYLSSYLKEFVEFEYLRAYGSVNSNRIVGLDIIYDDTLNDFDFKLEHLPKVWEIAFQRYNGLFTE